VIVDTSALLAYFNRSEPQHLAVATAIEDSGQPLIVSPYVLAELDYLISTRHGVTAELKVIDELTSGAWQLVSLEMEEIKRARNIIEHYSDQSVGLADAANVVLAERFGDTTVATLDRRHFAVLRTADGRAMKIVP
jgi:predicted nucleic acid-binding protein